MKSAIKPINGRIGIKSDTVRSKKSLLWGDGNLAPSADAEYRKSNLNYADNGLDDEGLKALDELSQSLEGLESGAGLKTEADIVRYIKEEIRPAVWEDWNARNA